MEKKRPVLSISMLVSNNRRDTIEKCMESLVPLRKAVPSELIIVDTGCTDGSVDIARKYADKVVEFTWCKDFSAARNTGLRECTGEWFLYLDDDEWFEDVSELVEFFQGEERQFCDALWYIQRNYDNFEGTVHTDAYVGRCVKLTPETAFCGKIHEYLFPHPKMIKKVNSYVHHYGYVFKTEEERLKHLERNLTLEEEAVRENPDDIRMCCQLVQEYWVARRFEEALKLAKEALERTNQSPTDSFVQYLWLVIPRLYKGKEDNERALAEFARLEKDYTLMHQTKLGLYYERAMTYGAMKREEDLIKEFFRYLNEFMVSPQKDAPVEHPIMDFAQYQSVSFYCKAVEFMVTNMICGDLYLYAEAVYDRIDWSQTTNPKEMVAGLFRCYEETGNAGLLKKHLPTVLQNPDLSTQVYGTLHELYERYPGKRSVLLTDLEGLNMRSGNLAYFHLLYTEQNGITTEQDIADYYEKSDRKYDAEVAVLFLTKTKQKMQLLAELNKMGRIEVSVKEYVRWARKYTEAVTEDGAWNRGELPQELPELWFARVMEFTFDVFDMAEYGGLIKEALSYCPVFLPVVKALLAEREMVTLAAQLKETAQAQLEAGRPEEAKAMLAELATMVPWDAEVKRMLLEL